jgi:hypothetical protein
MLLDHFHPPLSVRRHWNAFHHAWATYLAADLNLRLPPGYFAEPNVQFGIEIDVATFEESLDGLTPDRFPREVVPSLLTGTGSTWAPPAPAQTIPFAIATDQVEVLVFDREAGPTLVGAIELVRPANKDRAAHRDAFVSKCLTYLHEAIGLIVVDIVTARSGNLHDELLLRLAGPDAANWGAELYAAAYRPVGREGELCLDIWKETLAVGRALPTMPLWLPGDLCLPVELATTYERTCLEHRIMPENATLEPGR